MNGSPMDRVDALGFQPERRQVFTRELLAEADDEVLRKIVKQAADEMKTPIALVTLVLDRIQFFKAHYGLPPDLEALRGTERDISFCQFVVRDGKPFEVTDAPNDPRVPQYLVKDYGIRAYLGIPLHVGETVVGSLCVIDTKTRSFSDEEQEALIRLAKRVDERFQALAEDRRQTRLALADTVSAPAVAELRDSLAPMGDAIAEGLEAAATIRSFLRLSSHAHGGGSVSPKIMQRSLNAAIEAAEASENLLYEMEAAAGDSEDCVLALEYLMTPVESARLSDVLAAAQDLARQKTRTAGGARLPDLSFDPLISTSRQLAVALVTACLTRMSDYFAARERPTGIRMELSQFGGNARLTLSGEDFSAAAAAGIAEELSQRVAKDPSVAVENSGDSVHLIFVAVSGE